MENQINNSNQPNGAIPNTSENTNSPNNISESADMYSFASRVQIPQLQGFSIGSIQAWFTRLEAFFQINSFGRMNPDQQDQIKFNIAIMYMDEKLHEQVFDNPIGTKH